MIQAFSVQVTGGHEEGQGLGQCLGHPGGWSWDEGGAGVCRWVLELSDHIRV